MAARCMLGTEESAGQGSRRRYTWRMGSRVTRAFPNSRQSPSGASTSIATPLTTVYSGKRAASVSYWFSPALPGSPGKLRATSCRHRTSKSAISLATLLMRAGLTLPSHPRHHWTFQVMSFTEKAAHGNHRRSCVVVSRSFAKMVDCLGRIVTGQAVKRNLPNALSRAAFACALVLAEAACAQRLPVERIKLPPGFEISVFARGVPDARSLALGGDGLLFVGTRTAGRVYAVRTAGAKATEVLTLASGLNMPNGVAVRNGALYVAEVNRILRFDDVGKIVATRARAAPVVVADRYPRETHHGWKFIRFGPDGLLYVPVGAPCNICEPDDRHGLISRIRPDGTGYEAFARGIRNSVGFDWDPRIKELWFTDNGRDMLGDDLPSDELDHALAAGMHFGYPYCHQR